MNKPIKAFLALGLSFSLLVSCSSVQKADIPATADPHEEVVRLDAEINTAVTKNIDVLAENNFNKSKSYLDKAKVGIQFGHPQSDILDSIRSGKGHLNEAYAVAGNRESKAEGMFAARQMALTAGASTFTELRADLNRLDSKVSDIADELTETDAKDLSSYQNQYIDLERRAVILSQLGKTQSMVNGAQKENAEKKAPVSFKKAQLSLKTAESIISSNVRNPNGYQAAVMTARTDTRQLMNVLATIQQNGKLAEPAAIKMVAQNKSIVDLENDLSAANEQSEANEATMQNRNAQLASLNSAKDAQLSQANSKVRIQRAIENARTQFTTGEAEAYQQGENLVIRLKQVSFASGKSDLPAESFPVLAKVLDVAKSLDAAQIKVEGHTDSIGQESLNKTLSEERASAVGQYLKSNGFADIQIESEGYGYKKPIATNKSKEGRALNRRVDIVITPKEMTE